MRLAVRENMVPGDSFEAKLSCLASLGYDGIELTLSDTLARDPADLASACRSARIEVTTVPGSFDLLNPDRTVRQAAMALMTARIRLAAELRNALVLVVPIFGPPLLPDLSPVRTAIELETDLLVQELKELATEADAAGAGIIIEPLNRYETHLVNRLEQGVAIRNAVGSQRIQIMADFFHMNIEEADIAASIRAAGRHIQYVHVADSNRVQPGRGHLDMKPGFTALKDVGYDGFLGVECRLIGDPEVALAEAAINVREAWKTA